MVLAAAACAAAIPILATAASGNNLPDLRADPPANPYLQVYGDGRLLLRFDGYVTNVGTGPLDINGNPQATMYQRVSDGGALVNDHAVPVKFETADGHNHFHLMKIMRYSLWNQARTAEVAPGQKVGFCLYDYNKATNFSGTRAPAVYALGRPGDTFCNVGDPQATSLNMGVGSGWRDDYGAYLALQWVNVSDTSPGNYYLASDADPNDIIRESNEDNPRAFTSTTVAVPGYVPRPIGPVPVSDATPTQIPLSSDAFGSPGAGVVYKVTAQPARGSVTISGSTATYTPGAGSPGTYSFSYSAQDPSSAYPRTARTATATLQVGVAAAPSVTISGAPGSLTAGTSVQLSAALVNAGGGVSWTATAGTVSASGLYVAPAAPPPGGRATIRATSTGSPGTFAEVTIPITPAAAPVPAPASPGSGPAIAATRRGLPAGVVSARLAGGLGGPVLKRHRRTIVVRVGVRKRGVVRVAAVRGGKVVARCKVRGVPGRRAVCKLRVPARFAKKPVRIIVGLRTSTGTTTRRQLAR